MDNPSPQSVMASCSCCSRVDSTSALIEETCLEVDEVPKVWRNRLSMGLPSLLHPGVLQQPPLPPGTHNQPSLAAVVGSVLEVHGQGACCQRGLRAPCPRKPL
mmetsp:Transcript_130577/g.254452  ORF Transcript_130577/g.254452 Transcript_130577/m.254452 type:complete len:103 (-) Transcript_130577:223-531(-)